MGSGRASGGRLAVDRQTVEVSRSDWTIELGPLRVARHRSVRYQVEVGPPLRSRVASGGIGLAAVAALAVAAPVYLTQAKVLASPPYVVSQPVPERAVRPVSVRSPHVRRRRSPRPVADAIADDPPTDVARATAVAWRTGEPQDWAAGGAHGIVVPGEIERSDGFVCRSLARLTRQDGQPDAVEQSRRCSAVAPARPD